MAVSEIADLSILPLQAQEDELHASRLLGIEERPFKRVKDRILGGESILKSSLSLPSISLKDGDDDAATHLSKMQKFREDILLDFANLESSLVRIQLTLSSNERERERYAVEKAKILETAQAVRDNTVELRAQLLEAQRVLAQRKGYDEQAAKILDDKKLKSRDETRADIDKLEKEIGDLQQESAEYADTWTIREEYFNNAVREGDAMIRLIKGIKDEPELEKDADMEDAEDGDDGGKGDTSGRNSPLPDGRSPDRVDTSGNSPMHDSGEGEGDMGTPRPANKFLDVDDGATSTGHISSPLSQAVKMDGDTDMGDMHVEDAAPEGDQKPPSNLSNGGGNSSRVTGTLEASTLADTAMDET